MEEYVEGGRMAHSPEEIEGFDTDDGIGYPLSRRGRRKNQH